MCFSAANISTDMLPSLSKENLRDLFPGPEHFFRRTIWRFTHGENEGEESDLCRPGTSSGTWRDPHYLDAAPQRLNSWVVSTQIEIVYSVSV